MRNQDAEIPIPLGAVSFTATEISNIDDLPVHFESGGNTPDEGDMLRGELVDFDFALPPTRAQAPSRPSTATKKTNPRLARFYRRWFSGRPSSGKKATLRSAVRTFGSGLMRIVRQHLVDSKKTNSGGAYV